MRSIYACVAAEDAPHTPIWRTCAIMDFHPHFWIGLAGHRAANFAFSNAIEDANNYVSIYIFSSAALRFLGPTCACVYRYGPYVKIHRRPFSTAKRVQAVPLHTNRTGVSNNMTRFSTADSINKETCWRFAIPAGERRKVLKLLDEHNLNAFSLFGSEESMMETLAAREFDYANAIEENASSAQGTGQVIICS